MDGRVTESFVGRDIRDDESWFGLFVGFLGLPVTERRRCRVFTVRQGNLLSN